MYLIRGYIVLWKQYALRLHFFDILRQHYKIRHKKNCTWKSGQRIFLVRISNFNRAGQSKWIRSTLYNTGAKYLKDLKVTCRWLSWLGLLNPRRKQCITFSFTNPICRNRIFNHELLIRASQGKRGGWAVWFEMKQWLIVINTYQPFPVTNKQVIPDA